MPKSKKTRSRALRLAIGESDYLWGEILIAALLTVLTIVGCDYTVVA